MQKEKVLAKLYKEGVVDNFWAIRNNILRLGAVIYKLKNEGNKIEGQTGFELNKPRRMRNNYYYFLK